MKISVQVLVLGIALAAGLSTVSAQADQCRTESRGLRFFGDSRREVTHRCVENPITNKYECARDVSCAGDRWARFVTFSNGLAFYGNFPEVVIHECAESRMTRLEQCRENLREQRHEGDHGHDGDHGGGWHPGEGDHGHGGGWHPGEGDHGHGGGLPPPRSDAQCYLDRYPDICQNSPKNYCKDPAKHYREHGAAEHRIWGCR